MTEQGETIFQTDPQFPTAFDEACCFLALVKPLSILFKPELWDRGQIMELYESEEMDHDLLSDLTVENAQGICDHVAPGKVKYIGPTGAIYATQPNQFELLVWHRDGGPATHFTTGAGGLMKGTAGVVFYDPYSAEGSESVKVGQIIGKRIFQLT